MKRILVVCPSRNRVESCLRMIRSVEDTSARVDIAVYVDDDQAVEYHDALKGKDNVLVLVGKRIGPARATNALVRRFPDYDVYGYATDDCRFTVQGWDKWVRETAERNPLSLMSPAWGQRMDFPWATNEWVKAVGSFIPTVTDRAGNQSEFSHYFWDLAMEILGDTFGLVRRAGPHEFDLVHDDEKPEDRSSDDHRKIIFDDSLRLTIWAAYNRHDDIEKVQAALFNPASNRDLV